MKIVNETNRIRHFGTLEEGSVFIADECIFLKITEVNECDEDTFNAVMLIDGELTYFSASDKVEFFPDAFLTVK